MTAGKEKLKKWALFFLVSFVGHFFLIRQFSLLFDLPVQPVEELAFSFEQPEEEEDHDFPKEPDPPQTAPVAEPAPLLPPPRIIVREAELPEREVDPEAETSMFRDNSFFYADAMQTKGARKQLSLNQQKRNGSSNIKGLESRKQRTPPKPVYRKHPFPPSSASDADPKNQQNIPKESLVTDDGSFRFARQPEPGGGQKSLSGLLSKLDQYVKPSDFPDQGIIIGEGVSFSFDDQGFHQYVWFGRIIKKRVRDGWFPPFVATALGLTGRTIIRFIILKNGKVDKLRVVESSGNASLDNASLNAIRSAAPFPPLPDDYEHPHLGVVFSFWYNLSPRRS